MHKEEGIIDATDLTNAFRTHLCDTACLHRYHLFFLEIHHPNPFLPLRQGQVAPSHATHCPSDPKGIC